MKKIKGIIFCLPVILGCCMATNTYAKKANSFSALIAEEEKKSAYEAALKEKLRADRIALEEKRRANRIALEEKRRADEINPRNCQRNRIPDKCAQKANPFSALIAHQEKLRADEINPRNCQRNRIPDKCAQKANSFSALIAEEEKRRADEIAEEEKRRAGAESLQKYQDSDMSGRIDAAVGSGGRYLDKIYELFADSSQHRHDYIYHRANWSMAEQMLELDMHGYYPAEAKCILHDLIGSIRKHNRTAINEVLFITGVGKHNKTHEPILTDAIKEEAGKICRYVIDPNNLGRLYLYPFYHFDSTNNNT